MQNVLAIVRREVQGYFDGPLAYVAVPAFLVLVGAFTLFVQDVFSAGVASLRTMFFWSAVFMLLLTPALTMRLLAEEARTGSIELLVTLPLTEAEIVLGKFLGAYAVVLLAVALTLPYPVTMSMAGDLDLGPVLGGYLGLALLGAAFTAIGTAASALTRNQLVAFLVALVLCLLPFATGYALERVPTPLVPLVQYLTFESHFDALARGVVDLRDVVFHLSVVALFLHVAVFALERRRLA